MRHAAHPESPGWAAFVCTDQGAEIARAVLGRVNGDEQMLRGGGLSGAARVSTGVPVARRLLAEIGNMPVETACESVTEISQSGAEVIVLGHQADLATYRALRKAGALEYFAFPVTPDEIVALLSAPVAHDASPLAETVSPVIGVCGSNGGVGASLLAQNLAFLAASAKGAALETALIDGDLQFGAQAIDLDQADTPGFVEALSAPDRVDATFLEATMTRIGAQLFLYGHQCGAGQNPEVLEAGLARLVGLLRKEFGAVVLDLPRALLLRPPELAKSLDALIMVVPAGFAGVNAASRLLSRLKAESPDLRVLPVLSELRRDAGLSRKEIAKGLGQEIAAVLPRADAAMTRAHRAARPMIEAEPRSPYAKSVRALWNAAVLTEEKPRKSRRRLFG